MLYRAAETARVRTTLEYRQFHATRNGVQYGYDSRPANNAYRIHGIVFASRANRATSQEKSRHSRLRRLLSALWPARLFERWWEGGLLSVSWNCVVPQGITWLTFTSYRNCDDGMIRRLALKVLKLICRRINARYFCRDDGKIYVVSPI